MPLFPTVPLSSVATIKSGYAFKSAEWRSTGVPVVKIANVLPGKVTLEGCSFVASEAAASAQEFTTQYGDPLIAMSGATVGKIGRVRFHERALINQRVGRFRVIDSDVLDLDFLYYFLQLDSTFESYVSNAYGSAQPNISPSLILATEIPLPSILEQRAIAEVLGALDDKIAANTKLAETADDFLANEFARLVSISHEEQPLGAIADVNSTTIKPVKGGNLRYVDIASVGVGHYDFPELSPWDDAPSRARRSLRKGDTIWSTVRPNRRSHALVLSADELLVGSTGLAVLSPREVGFAYLYEVTKRPEFTTYLETVAEGSAYPAVRADKFLDAPVPILPIEDRSGFETTASALRFQVESLIEENRTIAATRDTLLPQLMSGKLRVKDIENTMGEMV